MLVLFWYEPIMVSEMNVYSILQATARQRVSDDAIVPFNHRGELLYQHLDRGILGFAANMSQPLDFLHL